MIYLDNAATTRPYPAILKDLDRIQADCYGNPSSLHPPGIEAAKVIEDSRKSLSNIFDVPLAGIVFCGSGTESDNLAIKGVFDTKKSGQKQIITTRIEHAAVLKSCEWLEKNHNISVDYVRIDPTIGQVDLEHLDRLISDNTHLVSIQHANSETGVVQDLASISKTIRSKNPTIIFHSDGVQAFSRIPVDLKSLGVDLYSISAHKFHGIKGAGALIMARNLPLLPLIHGGGQEQGLRSGTENVAAISGMGKAAEIAHRDLEKNHGLITAFADRFKTTLSKEIPETIIFTAPNTLPHIVSLSIPGLLGEVLLHHLAKNNIFVSTGSACNSTSKKLSSVLKEHGYKKERIMQTIRISFAASEIPKDQEKFIDKFVKIVNELKTVMGS
ncbi:cysteine desulfurase [bacterium]|nr:cysteine desulfurase [bacterium]